MTLIPIRAPLYIWPFGNGAMCCIIMAGIVITLFFHGNRTRSPCPTRNRQSNRLWRHRPCRRMGTHSSWHLQNPRHTHLVTLVRRRRRHPVRISLLDLRCETVAKLGRTRPSGRIEHPHHLLASRSLGPLVCRPWPHLLGHSLPIWVARCPQDTPLRASSSPLPRF